MRFGQEEPLVVLKETELVIGGNGRLVAMQEHGWSECDVIEIALNSIEATALGIALNRTAELAEWRQGKMPAKARRPAPNLTSGVIQAVGALSWPACARRGVAAPPKLTVELRRRCALRRTQANSG